jgi:hypothetical protein
MAKLSAHGYEVARLTKSWTLDHGGDLGSTEYRVVLSFRSDGHVMRNLTALGIHDTTYGGSPDHTYGWKVYKVIRKNGKAVTDPERILAWARALRDQSDALGRLIDFKTNVVL